MTVSLFVYKGTPLQTPKKYCISPIQEYSQSTIKKLRIFVKPIDFCEHLCYNRNHERSDVNGIWIRTSVHGRPKP
jgi:hypothetical protein